jgi:glycosyltransferase involved in cell wall biosynthesis
MTRRTVKRADRIIAGSEYVREELHTILGASKAKIVTVWDGVDASAYKAQTSPQPHGRDKYILFVSALLPHKNAEALLRGFKLLLDKYHLERHSVVIVGGGSRSYRTKLEKEVFDLGLTDQVKFTGRVPEVKSWYKDASIFVYPSRQEEFGLPALEAMASGIPVITSNRGSLPEVVGDAALLVDPDDVQGLAELMYSLLSDETLRSKMIQRGLTRARQFSWEQTAQKTVSVYEDAYADWSNRRGRRT